MLAGDGGGRVSPATSPSPDLSLPWGFRHSALMDSFLSDSSFATAPPPPSDSAAVPGLPALRASDGASDGRMAPPVLANDDDGRPAVKVPSVVGSESFREALSTDGLNSMMLDSPAGVGIIAEPVSAVAPAADVVPGAPVVEATPAESAFGPPVAVHEREAVSIVIASIVDDRVEDSAPPPVVDDSALDSYTDVSPRAGQVLEGSQLPDSLSSEVANDELTMNTNPLSVDDLLSTIVPVLDSVVVEEGGEVDEPPAPFSLVPGESLVVDQADEVSLVLDGAEVTSSFDASSSVSPPHLHRDPIPNQQALAPSSVDTSTDGLGTGLWPIQPRDSVRSFLAGSLVVSSPSHSSSSSPVASPSASLSGEDHFPIVASESPVAMFDTVVPAPDVIPADVEPTASAPVLLAPACAPVILVAAPEPPVLDMKPPLQLDAVATADVDIAVDSRPSPRGSAALHLDTATVNVWLDPGPQNVTVAATVVPSAVDDMQHGSAAEEEEEEQDGGVPASVDVDNMEYTDEPSSPDDSDDEASVVLDAPPQAPAPSGTPQHFNGDIASSLLADVALLSLRRKVLNDPIPPLGFGIEARLFGHRLRSLHPSGSVGDHDYLLAREVEEDPVYLAMCAAAMDATQPPSMWR